MHTPSSAAMAAPIRYPNLIHRLLLLLVVSCCGVCHGAADTFTCDTNLTLPSSYVNDNYCDCRDMTDEPQTSACSTFQSFVLPSSSAGFHCHNDGFLPRNLSFSMVDDGICDCCDGSDEHSTACSNDCHEQAVAFVGRTRALLASYKSALSSRSHLISRIPAASKAYQSELDWLHDTLPSVYMAKEEAEREWDNGAGPVEAQQRMMQATQQVNYLMRRYYLVCGVLGTKEEQVDETPQETADRNKKRRKEEKEERKRMKERGEKVPKRTKMDKMKDDWENRPQQVLKGKKAPQSTLSDVWLGLHELCFSRQWEERRYGDKGVETDEYTVTLCPLHNATQTKVSGDEDEDEPAKPISLGVWDGMIRTSEMRVIAKRVEARRREKGRRDEQVHIANTTGTPLPATTMAEFAQLDKAFHDAEAVDTIIYQHLYNNSGINKNTTAIDLSTPPSYWLRYIGGEQCVGVGAREVDLQVVCGSEAGRLREVRENGKCRYEMVLESSAACDGKWGREAAKELDRLEKEWGLDSAADSARHDEL